MPPTRMTPELFSVVAERFRAFSEPTRLQIMHALGDREHTVTELIKVTGLGQANLSKHLGQLHAAGFVSRRKDGVFTYYAIADRDVLKMCDLMCGRISKESTALRKALGAG